MRSTTRRSLLAFHLSGTLSLAALAAAEDAPLRLTVHWSDPEGQFPFAVADLAAEARALFAPLGIALAWASADDTSTSRDHVQVILLARDRSNGRMGGRALACVQTGPQSQATAWIVVPRVRASLGLPAHPLPGEGPMLARALARVMAHELVHLMAPALPHANGGLMNASMGRDFLVRLATPAIDAAVAHAVRSAFADAP